MSSDKTNLPFLAPEGRVKISLGALVGIIMTTVAGAAAWTLVRSDVQKAAGAIAVHDLRLDKVETKLATDHDILLEIRADVKAITRERTRP